MSWTWNTSRCFVCTGNERCVERSIKQMKLPNAKEERLPLWPLRLTLTVLLVIEVFFVLRLTAEGVTDNILMIVNSVGLIVFSVLTWRGIPLATGREYGIH